MSRVSLWVGMALCLLCIMLGAAWSWADYQAQNSKAIIDGWLRGDTVSEKNWQRAHRHLKRALSIRPSNALFLEDMAELHHWRSAQEDVSTAELDQSMMKSLSFYRRAIAERPLWPYAWGNLALIKAQLGLWDAEFETALRNAQLLGPWEPAVQLAIHEAGLISWRELKVQDRQLLISNYKNSFSVSYPHVKNILDVTAKYQYLTAFCYYAKQQQVSKNIHTLIDKRCD